ncbi:hypothetical protein [Anaerobacterium chartisolvens]|uniref:hypothetical protein n=1 Tax=Anaerobacterium chartisolvens TaxID=1297424 RepID=UPI000DF4B3C9|nr:hypothetical protein [Anaerobacterium chartisolvens]
MLSIGLSLFLTFIFAALSVLLCGITIDFILAQAMNKEIAGLGKEITDTGKKNTFHNTCKIFIIKL